MNTASSPILSAENLSTSVSFAGAPLNILHDVSFSVAAGDSLAIVGASGSGKSTLLGLLAGLDTPSLGSVVLAGQTMSQLNEDGRAALRASRVGFVFQQFQLLPALNALENVMLPLELAGRADARASAKAILERVGLATRMTHYPRQLSGGEQQRVALARAFVGAPSVLFADEPTGSLDSETGAQIVELMFAMNAAAQTTLILVTHDEALARRCSRQIRLSGGRLQAIAE